MKSRKSVLDVVKYIVAILVAGFLLAIVITLLFGLLGWNIVFAPLLLLFLGMIFTIYSIVKNLDNNLEKHIISRYVLKGFWYFLTALSTFILFIDELFIIQSIFEGEIVLKEDINSSILAFKGILIFIVFHECIDNFTSICIENEKNSRTEFKVKKSDLKIKRELEKKNTEIEVMKEDISSMKNEKQSGIEEKILNNNSEYRTIRIVKYISIITFVMATVLLRKKN